MGFGISGVETLCSAARELVSKMDLMEMVVRMGGGWNWLRIVCSDGFWY